MEILNGINGVTCVRPQSGIVLFPDISKRGSSEEVVKGLLEHSPVAVHPGSRYGKRGEGHVRICFGSVSFPRYQEGLERIKDFFRGGAPFP